MAKHSMDLFLCDFPLYSLAPLGKNDFYVAGGGGQAKTGVPNAIVSECAFYIPLDHTSAL